MYLSIQHCFLVFYIIQNTEYTMKKYTPRKKNNKAMVEIQFTHHEEYTVSMLLNNIHKYCL